MQRPARLNAKVSSAKPKRKQTKRAKNSLETILDGLVRKPRTKTQVKSQNPGKSKQTSRSTEILAKAEKVFGTQSAAKEWLARPAMGLNQECPINLLKTTEGTRIIENFLEQLEYGVYV